MKNIVIYSNCQGKAIIDILKHHITFCKDYDIENFINIINYEIIKNKEDIPIKSLEACDLFIHQPIKDKHGIYSTQNIISYLKPECIQISFPYIYIMIVFGNYYIIQRKIILIIKLYVI